MKNIECSQVQNWLLQIDSTEDPDDSLFAAVCDHVAHCYTCQGAILLLLAEHRHNQATLSSTTCEDCQQDLAAYIDTEREAGTLAALQEYPHVWWHLLTCQTCFESYRMIMHLINAEQTGQLPSIHSVTVVQKD